MRRAAARTLLFLCAKAGKDDYAREMRAGHPTLLDLLNRWVGGRVGACLGLCLTKQGC